MCDDFQGQEAKITIVSTVLSKVRNTINELGSGCGIVGSAKRFNVAMTRAKSLNIVVGHPQVLASDYCLGRLLVECAKEGRCRGEPCPRAIYEKAGLNPDDGMLDGGDAVVAFVDHLAEISMLGLGALDDFYPTDLDAHYAGGARGFKMNF